MPELRKEQISIMLLLLRRDCCDFVTILERDSVFSTLCCMLNKVEKTASDKILL